MMALRTILKMICQLCLLKRCYNPSRSHQAWAVGCLISMVQDSGLSKPSSISVANIQTTAIHMPHWFPGASFMHESQEWLPYITVVILYSVCCPGMPVCHYFLGDRTAKSS